MASLIVDSHLDLAMNAVQVNRDITQDARTIRAHDPRQVLLEFGSSTVGLPDLRHGEIGIVFGTVIARIDRDPRNSRIGMYTQSQCYAAARAHHAYYQALERRGEVRLVHSSADLDDIAAAWGASPIGSPIGLVLTMESADPILGPTSVPEWRALGLRMVSLSHYGVSTYCFGTGTEGGLLPAAKPLLSALEENRIIVDLTHTADQAFWEVLDNFGGQVAASHHNCRALVPGQRQLTDDMIREIVGRDGVIGSALDAWMLDPKWDRRRRAFEQATAATLESVADHIEYVCALAGTSRHAGIGSDLDGGYGQEQSPRDLNTIADMQRFDAILRNRGFSDEDVSNVLSGNWIRLMRQAM